MFSSLKEKIGVLAIILMDLALATPVFADPQDKPTGLPEPKSWLNNSLIPGLRIPVSGLGFFTDHLVPNIISLLVFVVIIGSFFMILVGGIMMITSAGNKEATSKAKATITSAIIGLFLGLGSFIIMSILFQVLGV